MFEFNPNKVVEEDEMVYGEYLETVDKKGEKNEKKRLQ